MARTRYLKPEFFEDEDLAEHPFWVRILYEGLWVFADREGRLEERIKRLKVKIFPYDDVDIEEGLSLLASPKSSNHKPFIIRYEVNGERYIQIVKWHKHQNPHHTEKESDIPPPPDNNLAVSSQLNNGDLTVKKWLTNGDNTVKEPLSNGVNKKIKINRKINRSQREREGKGGTGEGEEKEKLIHKENYPHCLTDFLNFKKCKKELVQEFNSIKITNDDKEKLALHFCTGVKVRARCHKPERCRDNLRYVLVKIQDKPAKNPYGYIIRSIDNFLKGE